MFTSPSPPRPPASPRGNKNFHTTSLKEMLEQQNVEQEQSGERGRVLSRDAYLALQRKGKGPNPSSPRGLVGQSLPAIPPIKPNSATLSRRDLGAPLPATSLSARPQTSRGPATASTHKDTPSLQELVDPTRTAFVNSRSAGGGPSSTVVDPKTHRREVSANSMTYAHDTNSGSNVSALDGRLHVSSTSGKLLMPDRTAETMASGQQASRFNHGSNNDNGSTSPGSAGGGGSSILRLHPAYDDQTTVDLSCGSTQPGSAGAGGGGGEGTPRERGIHTNGALVVMPTPPAMSSAMYNAGGGASASRYSLEHPTQQEVSRSMLSDSINDLCGILTEYRELRIGLSEEERDKLIDLSCLANWNELKQLSGGADEDPNTTPSSTFGTSNNTNTRPNHHHSNGNYNSVVISANPSDASPLGATITSPMSPLLWHLYNRASVVGLGGLQPMSTPSGGGGGARGAGGDQSEASGAYVGGSGAATPYLPPYSTDRPLAAEGSSSSRVEGVGSAMFAYNNPSRSYASRASAPTPPSAMSFGRQEGADSSAVLGSPRQPYLIQRPITPACGNRSGFAQYGTPSGTPSVVLPPSIPSVPADMVDWMCTTCQDMLAQDVPMTTVLNGLVEQVQQSVPEVYTINVWVYSSSQNLLYRLDNERVQTATLSDTESTPSSSSLAKPNSGSAQRTSSASALRARPVSRLVDGSHTKVPNTEPPLLPSESAINQSQSSSEETSTEKLVVNTFITKVPKADPARIVIPLFLTPTHTPSLPTKDGVYGVLEILGCRGSELNTIDASQSAVLCSVGSFIYSILHHRRQRERYNRKVQSVDSVVQIANQLANVTNLDENKLVSDIMAVAMSVCDAERSALFLPSPTGDGSLSEMIAHGSGGQILRVPQGSGIVGHVAETGVGMNVDNAYTCPYFYEEADKTNNYTTKAVLCLPVHNEGSIVAVAELINKKTKSSCGGSSSSFTKEDEEHFGNLATLIGLCLRNCKKNQELIVEKAKIEALFASVLEISATDITKLPNVLSGIVDTACTLGQPVFNFAFVVRWDVELQELLVDSSLFPTNRRPRGRTSQDDISSSSKSVVQDDSAEDSTTNFDNLPQSHKRYSPSRGVAGLCYTTGEVQLALNCEDGPFDPEVDVPFLSANEASHVSALLSIPLMSGKDVIGILQFVRVDGGYESLTETAFLSSLENESKAIMAVVNPSSLAMRSQSSGSMASRGPTPQVSQRPPRGGSASSRSRTQEAPTTGGAWLTLRQSPVPIERWGHVPGTPTIVPHLPKGIRPPGRHAHSRPNFNTNEASSSSQTTEAGLSRVYEWDELSGPSNELISLLKGFAVFAAIWIHNADLIDFTVKAGKAATKLSTVFRSKRPGAKAQTHVDRSEVNLVLRTAVPDIFASSIGSPDFNLWAVRQNADVAPLLVASRIVFDLMWSTGLPQQFGCREETLATFIVACRSKYRPVPYHNFFHAVDVTQTIFHYLYTGGVAECLTPLEQFVVMVVGLTHDLDHMGLNNNFHMKTDTPLGILSAVGGSQSVLEVRHCNLAVDILSAEESNIFEGLSKDDVITAYHLLIEAILGTDMAKHATSIHQLKEWETSSFDFNKTDHRKFAFNLVVKIADVSNVSKPFDVSKKWAVAVTEEFSQQGDNEKRQGISDILPLFDREKNADLAKGQLGFIQFVAEPFFKLAVEKLFPKMSYALENIAANLETWRELKL